MAGENFGFYSGTITAQLNVACAGFSQVGKRCLGLEWFEV
jgi:hypothetical protein